MSSFNWCHGPSCHKSHTQDRIRGVKGSKVLRTKKVQQYTQEDRIKVLEKSIEAIHKVLGIAASKAMENNHE